MTKWLSLFHYHSKLIKGTKETWSKIAILVKDILITCIYVHTEEANVALEANLTFGNFS